MPISIFNFDADTDAYFEFKYADLCNHHFRRYHALERSKIPLWYIQDFQKYPQTQHCPNMASHLRLKIEKNGRFFLPFLQKTGDLWLPKNWLPHWLPQGGGHQRSPEKKPCLGGGGHVT